MPSDNEIEHIAKVAATAAAEVVATAAAAATTVANTASAAAASLQATQAADMAYIKKDIAEINAKLDNKYVTKDETVKVKEMSYDHETRMRVVEKSVTQTQTYGAVALILLGIAEVALRVFWK